MANATRAHWQRVNEVDASYGRSLLVSDRRVDEAQCSGTRPYMHAAAQQSVCQDNLEALIALLSSHGSNPWAAWNLIRPIYESSTYALWLLEPGDSMTRRIRGLRFEVIGYRQQRAYLQDFAINPANRRRVQKQLAKMERGSEKQYRAEADELGVDWGDCSRDINVHD